MVITAIPKPASSAIRTNSAYPVGFVAELDDDQLSLGQQAVSQLLADRVGCLTGSEGTDLTSFVQTSLLTALLMGGYFPNLPAADS